MTTETRATVVADTNVLLNFATPVVDGRSTAPTGADPLLAVLTAYDVHVPAAVLGEVSTTAGGDDLLAAAADLVLGAARHVTTHDVEEMHEGTGADAPDASLEYGLDTGESHGIWLANEIDAAMFVTDEFSTTNYLLASLALDDRNILFTTPHVLCKLAEREVLDPRYVDSLLAYYVETKDWDRTYVDRLRDTYLPD